MHVPCIFILFVLQPTNAQKYITIFSLYAMFTPICFDTSMSSSGSFKNLYFATLHQFLELKLLKLQFHKIIRRKLFGHHWVIQYSPRNVTISFERSVFMWLHIQYFVTVICVLVWHVTRYCNIIQTILYYSMMTNNFYLIILWNCNLNSFNSENWCNIAKYKFLKLPEDDTEVSKHVGVNIVYRGNIVIYICTLVGCNTNFYSVWPLFSTATLIFLIMGMSESI